MEPEEAPKSVKVSKEDFDASFNRIALAFAKHESLIKSWSASSSRPRPPEKSQAELDAEDAAIFRNEPAHLGVGAAIPAHFLLSEAERGNKSLRQKLFPSSTLKASKARDAEEKAASAKRGLKDESSDEEEGRSGLGKAKKRKTKATVEAVTEPAKAEKLVHREKHLKKQSREEKGQNGNLSKTGPSNTHQAPTSKAELTLGRTKVKNLSTPATTEPEIEMADDDQAGDGAPTVDMTEESSASVPAMLQRKQITDPKELKRLRNKEKKRKKKEREKREKLMATGKA